MLKSMAVPKHSGQKGQDDLPADDAAGHEVEAAERSNRMPKVEPRPPICLPSSRFQVLKGSIALDAEILSVPPWGRPWQSRNR
jgi:hypothetical protein